MDAKEKERRIDTIRLRAVLLESPIIDLRKTGGIDMRQEIISFFKEEEEDESKSIG